MKPIQIEIGGVSHTFREWAKITGLSESTIKSRYYNFHITGKDLISPPKKKTSMQVSINGESHTFKEWSEITGISIHTLRSRYYHGATAEEFLKPVRRKDDRNDD